MPTTTPAEQLQTTLDTLLNLLKDPHTTNTIPLLPLTTQQQLTTLCDTLIQDKPIAPAPLLRVPTDQRENIAPTVPKAPAPPASNVPADLPPMQRRSKQLTAQQQMAPPSTPKQQCPTIPQVTPERVHPAVNVDTGLEAEYKELAQSSQGPRWKIAMANEI